MTTDISKLIFFDKNGYPYNFQYDDVNKIWEGKIFFEENSSDTFRTLCLYLFESVPAYDINTEFSFHPSELFNYSGMTFVGATYQDEPISGITRVNSNSNFYSKWIRGENFDKKFPVGTVIQFNDVTGTGDNDFYSGLTYNVLGTQKNAFLICSETCNSGFTFSFSGGTVSSINVIKVADFGIVDFSGLTYYPGKLLSIINSNKNDGIFTYVTGFTQTSNANFAVMNPNIKSEIKIDFDLLTQRPELYEGMTTINYNTNDPNDHTGTTIKFHNGINTNVDFVNTGQTIIFETPDGLPIMSENLEFTITGYIDRQFITKDTLNFYTNDDINTIEAVSGVTGLTYNDIIELTVTTYLSGQTFHNNRQFQVMNVTDNIIQVREYIIVESGHEYTINKVINKKKINEIYCKGLPTLSVLDPYTGYTICYSTTNHITLSQYVIDSGTTNYYYENTISAMRNKYRYLLNRYGLDIYTFNYLGTNLLIFEGSDYNFNPSISGFTVSLNLGGSTTGLTTGTLPLSVIYNQIEEQLTYEKTFVYDTSKLSINFRSEIYFDLEKDMLGFGFKVKINNEWYYIALSGSTGTYEIDTINNFISTYSDTLNKKGFNIYSGYTTDIYTGYTLVIEGEKPNVDLYDVEVKVNSYSNYDIIEHTRNNSIVISSNEIKSTAAYLNEFELATGMIINLSGAKSDFNNKQYNILRLTGLTSTTLDTIQLSYQGPFEYEEMKDLTLSVNSFIRKPRGTYGKDIYYRCSWEPIDENNPKISDNIFFYDFSGDQLSTTGTLAYQGIKPLWEDSDSRIFLNKEPNKQLDKIYDPSAQQTIFSAITYSLERLDSSTDYNYVPVPIQIFLGFNSVNEGFLYNKMIISKIDDIVFSGRTNSNISYFTISGDTITYTTTGGTFSFIDLGFNYDQLISIDFKEVAQTGHTLFSDWDIYDIANVTKNQIKISGNTLHYFTTSGKTFDFIIKTEPVEIASFYIYGQTEIEDERYVQHLKLLGANLDSNVQPIFKESDINDKGIDYTILNRKRKELLSVYPDIYNYIGAYKSLINAINFFGYNDLDLYEYYRNIDPKSPLYGKLQKTLIEDIFINTIPGWDEIEMDSTNHLKTNLFNLTYKITDFDGNYLYLYSLDEVQIKLNGLVDWLRKHIIPLSANILDITGEAHVPASLYANFNGSNYVKKVTTSQINTAINFDYIQTLNIDNDYLFTINFYIVSGSTMPDYFTVKIKTFKLNEETMELVPVQYFDLYKKDLLSFSFNVDRIMDPYMFIETQTFNDYGLGYTNSRLFNYNEGRNFVLIDNNFVGVNYKYITTDYGYYIITDGRFYIIPY